MASKQSFSFQALLEERKCHCFLLQRLCAISGISSAGYRRGVDLYGTLAEWRDLCADPQILPPQAEQFIAQHLVCLFISARE